MSQYGCDYSSVRCMVSIRLMSDRTCCAVCSPSLRFGRQTQRKSSFLPKLTFISQMFAVVLR